MSDLAQINDIISKARAAQKAFEQNATQERFDRAAQAVAWALMEPNRNKALSAFAVAETGIGNVPDKIMKNHRKTLGLMQDLQGVPTFGHIEDDDDAGLSLYLRPKGVVAAIVPSTNPLATPVNNAVNALKTGNAIILAPSPKGAKPLETLLGHIHEELDKVGASRDLVQMVPNPPSKEKTAHLMAQADVLIATGSQNNVKSAYASGTPAIGVGMGNVVTIIDTGIDCNEAAAKIAASKTFDNATSCSSENAVIVLEPIYDQMLVALMKAGGYLLSPEQVARLEATYWQDGKMNRAMMAQDIDKVLAALDITDADKAVSAIMMMAATPVIAKWAVTSFGPPEIFALICFGLAVSASVGAKTLWKGWMSIFLGLAIATVGTDPVGGIRRFNEWSLFGFETSSYYLSAGVHFIPVILGFFAVSEVLTQAQNIAGGTRERPKASMQLPSIAEFWAVRITALRSTILGFFAGVLPGIGATLAAFLGYSQAVRWSKTPENYGKGELDGVVASETANNAATGAAMIPLLALGLPGGALTAMMLGIFQIHGMEPGPLIFINSHDLVWVMFAAMFWANVAILGLGWIQTKTVVHILRLPFRWLAPGILLLAVIGAFALRNLLIDVWVMLLAGIVGYFLRRTGYSAAGIVLGLILGKLGESAFAKSMQLLDYSLWGFGSRPIAAVLLIAACATIINSIIREIRAQREAKEITKMLMD